jgi:hypothetical protein
MRGSSNFSRWKKGSVPNPRPSAPLRGLEKLSFLTKKDMPFAPEGQGAAMKQPIAGIAGTKPRGPKPEGDGHLSKQESRALDREYRLQRNQSLQLKNHREQMLLARARGELVEKRLVELQASFLLIAMRRRGAGSPAGALRLLGGGGRPPRGQGDPR